MWWRCERCILYPHTHTHTHHVHTTYVYMHAQDFRRELGVQQSQYDVMMSQSEVWADHLVPDESLGDLPSPSEESGTSLSHHHVAGL